MAYLEHYIRKVYDHESKHPSQDPRGRIFPETRSAPRLDATQTNHILVYVGSFNPPHQGHLRLLRHTFYHGVPDLNVVGAIVRPSVDDQIVEKCRQAGGSFCFGRDERCMLWKQDMCFPDWAWAYEAESYNFADTLDRLKNLAREDNFEIEFVCLRGPIENDHTSPPRQESFKYGSSTLIISDAARLTNYQRSCGYMRDFKSYTRWKGLRFEEESLKKCFRDKTQLRLETNNTVQPQEAQEIIQALDSTLDDVRNIIYCRCQILNKIYTIRFVKCQDPKQRKDYSSSELRQAMSSSRCSEHLKKVLDEIALSPNVLWEHKAHWMEKAKARKNGVVTWDPIDDQVPEEIPADDQGIGKIEQEEEADGVQSVEDDTAHEGQGKIVERKCATPGADSLPAIKSLKISELTDGIDCEHRVEEEDATKTDKPMAEKREEHATSPDGLEKGDLRDEGIDCEAQGGEDDATKTDKPMAEKREEHGISPNGIQKGDLGDEGIDCEHQVEAEDTTQTDKQMAEKRGEPATSLDEKEKGDLRDEAIDCGEQVKEEDTTKNDKKMTEKREEPATWSNGM